MSAPIVFIVGTGDYIGAAIARRFAEGGFTVCMGRRNGHKLEPLVNELRGMGGKAYGYTHDARDEEQTEAIFKEIETNVGPIDLVIFNVGGNVYFPLMETTARVCIERSGKWPALPGFSQDERPRAIWSHAVAAKSFSQAPLQACAGNLATPPFQREKRGCACWLRAWLVSLAPKTSMSRISLLMQVWTPLLCASGSLPLAKIQMIFRLTPSCHRAPSQKATGCSIIKHATAGPMSLTLDPMEKLGNGRY